MESFYKTIKKIPLDFIENIFAEEKALTRFHPAVDRFMILAMF